MASWSVLNLQSRQVSIDLVERKGSLTLAAHLPLRPLSFELGPLPLELSLLPNKLRVFSSLNTPVLLRGSLVLVVSGEVSVHLGSVSLHLLLLESYGCQLGFVSRTELLLLLVKHPALLS